MSKFVIAAVGGYRQDNGEPYIAWPVSFDGGATFIRPQTSVQLDEAKPQAVLWKGSEAEYNALQATGYAALQWPPLSSPDGSA